MNDRDMGNTTGENDDNFPRCPVFAKQVPVLMDIPQELRNRIYQWLFLGSILWLSGETTHEVCPRALVNLGEFHWPIVAVCRQARTEALPLLLSATLLWTYNEWYERKFDIARSIAPIYLSGIIHMRQYRPITLKFNLNLFKNLRCFEICALPLEWHPQTEAQCAAEFNNGRANSRLIRMARRHLKVGDEKIGLWLYRLGQNKDRGFRVVIGNMIYGRIPGMVMMLEVRGFEERLPSKDDQDANFELIYDYDTGRIVQGRAEAIRAVERMLPNFEYDRELDDQLEKRSEMSEREQTYFDREQDEWYWRTGEIDMAPGRGWAWTYSLHETMMEKGPGPTKRCLTHENNRPSVLLPQ